VPVGSGGGRLAAVAHLAVTVDCADPARLAEFWRELLGYRAVGSVAQYASIGPDGDGVSGPKIIFQAVEEPKAGKNRLHLDLDLDPGVDLGPAVERALALGARVVVEEPVEEFGLHWQVLADPEGNEFCIVARPAG
jgi:catechol 2,3-dioxygenase-like lactoylglutathione lyase family enzyme